MILDVKTKMVPEFLEWCRDAGKWEDFDVVGFSSTFNQNIASLTLAKMIKEKFPHLKILFGGSNFESEMGLEYFRVAPWIDYVVPGEAEDILPNLVDYLEKFQIKIKYFVSGNYLKEFFSHKKIELSEMAFKLKNGENQNEVIVIPKTIENKGFFEKFFQLFS